VWIGFLGKKFVSESNTAVNGSARRLRYVSSGNPRISAGKKIQKIFFYLEDIHYICILKHNTMQTLKIKENLWVRGNDVISYETIVAKIVGDKLVELGKFSRTTSKHVQEVARRFRLKIEFTKKPKKEYFYKYEQGVKCETPGALTQKTSLHISDAISEGMDYLNATASVPNLPKRDLVIIENWLRLNGTTVSDFQELQKWHKMKSFI